MKGVFTTTYKITGVTTAKTLAYLTAGAAKPSRIRAISVTDANQLTAEQLDILVAPISSLSPTPTATTLTPLPTDGSTAAGAVVKGNVTNNEPTYQVDGNTLPQAYDHQTVPNTLGYYWTPEDRGPVVAGGASFGVKLNTTLANSTDLVIAVTHEELG